MRLVRALSLIVLAPLAACDYDTVSDPPPEASIDVQLRQTFGMWGVMPLLPMRAPEPALVDLGRSLFFDRILSGSRDVSCATCHDPLKSTTDGKALAVGTGASGHLNARTLGDGRQFTPRNAPGLFNAALGNFYMFWDGSVSEEGGFGSRFKTPAGAKLPATLTSLLAAQAMIPVTNRVEMRGKLGDRDVLGNVNELAAHSDDDFVGIWSSVMKRLLSIDGYVQKFAAAYPGTPANQLGFQHAANAIAAFETHAFAKTNSAFDRYLARNDNALTMEQKRGALLFFGRARCSSCHSGALLGAQQFANVGAPQVGPGAGRMMPLDAGREDNFMGPQARFFFRVPPLRNVELTAPYTHAGAYRTLDAVVKHYNDVEKAIKGYDVSQLDPDLRSSYHGDATTISTLLATVDPRVRSPLQLTDEEERQLVAFLKSLTDPAARDLSSVIPASVPSGLPVR